VSFNRPQSELNEHREAIEAHFPQPSQPEEPMGRAGSLAWDVGGEPMQDCVMGMDPEPADVDAPQQRPPCDECVAPPAPDC
jgi:hypothetical protein